MRKLRLGALAVAMSEIFLTLGGGVATAVAGDELCPDEATDQFLCKEALYKTEAGTTKAFFRRQCNWRWRSRDWASLDDCNSYLDTATGQMDVPKPVADASEKIGRAMVRALGTRPDGFGQKTNLYKSQFPRFYDLTVEHTSDFCVRYKMKFPFGGDAFYCVDGHSDDTVRLIAPISLQDAITIARTELKKMGLGQTDPDGLGPIALLGFNLREVENGKVEYVVIFYERQPQPPGGPAQYPSIQYNFVIDAATKQLKFAKAPFDTPVSR